MSPFDPSSYLVLSAAVFAGAVISGLVGFAFSAAAGAILLHVLPPTEAVPLMMACSMVPQATSLVALRGIMRWRGSLAFMAGGALGIVPALYLLHQVDGRMFRTGFGAFLVVYAGCMLLRPTLALVRGARCWLRDAAVGFGGGLVGGLTAMPGALPVIWCDLSGMPKDRQRGLVQPYIAVMQVLALALILSHNGVSTKTLLDLTFSLPAVAAGTALGVVMFGRVNDALFRRVVLVVLLVAGLCLVV
jgi:uncharacterized membrane protein YfcA